MKGDIKINPLISIITPSYNSKRFVANTIDSIRKQTYQNYELIIIDDCSKDGSLDYIKKYVENDSKIRIFQLEKNSGAAVARNFGIHQAQGKYLAFLDSDDTWHPQKLEKQVKFMENKGCIFSYTNYKMMDELGNDLNRDVLCPKSLNYKQLLRNTTIGCLTVMLNIEKLGKVQMPNLQPEDTALWLKILKGGFDAYCLPEILASYRIVGNSASSNKIKVAKKMWKLYRQSENLSVLKTTWYFSGYACNAIKKHYF